MLPSDKVPPVSVRPRDIPWHIGKTCICLLQFAVASWFAWYSVDTLARANLDDLQKNAAYWLILFLTQAVLYFFLWNYYDDIDDRAFDRFCASDETPNFFRDPAYLVGYILSTVGGAACFLCALQPLLRILLPTVPVSLPAILGMVTGLLTAGGISAFRLRRRAYIWRVQKTLRRPNDKRPSPVKRVLYAVIFGFVVILLAVLGTSVIPYLVYFLISVLLISTKGFLLFIAALAAGMAFLVLRRVRERRKFFRHLDRLRSRGEISYTVHGHPYLSLFFRRAAFGMTLTDEPHPEARVKAPVTYQIAVANCNRRRMTVVLCEDNRFQFMHALKLRVLGNAHVPALGQTTLLNIPLGAFFTTRSFDFPEGEGKRILLVDPAPHQLCMRGFKEGELIPLDNASEVFGYTVYSKNAFARLLERT